MLFFLWCVVIPNCGSGGGELGWVGFRCMMFSSSFDVVVTVVVGHCCR